ncbi:MAG: four-carbon acid sugar kinase family protein [SAR202 cluster bacterium]|nr:four-carbon acid sugar kinase family protein [SAR202 cluster bacterium]
MTKLSMGVIADDLTGAMDTAGAFASKGQRVRVMCKTISRPSLLTGVGVACINTQTRNVDPAFALAPVRHAAKDLVDAGFGTFYKKIDSTGRGNLAAEFTAMLETTEAVAIIVCPAFPRLGRTVVDGRVLVHGRPVQHTTEGQDALAPVTSGNLVELLTAEGELTAASVGRSIVDAGPGTIAAEIKAQADKGHNVVVVDAVTDGHLDSLADASHEFPGFVLAGSAGLAYAIAGGMGGSTRNPVDAQVSGGPTLVIVGSRHETNRGQLRALVEKGRATQIALEPGEALSEPVDRRVYMARLLESVRAELSAGHNVSLAWSDAELTSGSATNPVADATDLDLFVGTLAYGTVRSVELSGLVIVGGDTAFAALGALGGISVDVAGEVEPGVPYGVIADGPAAGVVLVTKAGGFGDERTLVRALDLVEGLTGS